MNIDPENEMAIIMLSKVEQRLQPTSQALTRVPEPEARGLQTSSAEGEPNLDIAKKKEIKIGLEEALAVMREKGVEPDPEKVPVGGARLRSAIESGILKPGRIRRHRRLSLPRIALGGLGLSLALLISLALLSGVGLYFVIAQPSFEPVPTPTPAPTSTPAPTATAAPILSPAEIFAGKLRQELERYNRYLTNVKTMVDQQRANKLQWEDFRRNFDDLQKQLKDEKKVVDGLANTVVPQLLTTYKGLQDLAVTMINGTDYMVSGIHNYEPDDLDEALRQFSRASNQIAELANQLNQIIPLPTTTPVVIEPTPEITATTTENIPTLAAPAITITLQATTPTAPTVTTPGTASATSEPAVTPTPTGTPDSTETPSATPTGSPAP